jgi:nucleotide-binding universal stress UspA family protein
VADRLQLEADQALAHAVEILGGRAEKRYLNGFVTSALLAEIKNFNATLLAIGTHGHHRTTEILLGGPAGELLHRAPRSVLVARPADPGTFPRTIVVGHDGSRQAADALAAARHPAARYGSSLK